MTLKQLTNSDRIIFLQKFMAELLINISEEQEKEQRIKAEKLKQKFIQPQILPEEAFRKIIKTPIFEHPKELKKREKIQSQRIKQIREIQEKKKIQKFEELKKEPIILPKKPSLTEKLRRPIFYRAKKPAPVPMRRSMMPPQPIAKSKSLEPVKQIQKTKPISKPPEEDLRKIRPEAEPRPEGFALGKIETFLKDKLIQSIECAGPGKRVLVKRLNKINTTKITLGQPEITGIINSFSKQARIPVMGGILKAAVGDMIISAVISEYVGSRFIINKITPYSQLGIR